MTSLLEERGAAHATSMVWVVSFPSARLRYPGLRHILKGKLLNRGVLKSRSKNQHAYQFQFSSLFKSLGGRYSKNPQTLRSYPKAQIKARRGSRPGLSHCKRRIASIIVTTLAAPKIAADNRSPGEPRVQTCGLETRARPRNG